MIGGRSALLSAASSLGYGNWTGNYEDVSLLLRNGAPALVSLDESSSPKTITEIGGPTLQTYVFKYGNSSFSFDGLSKYLTVPDVIELEFGSSNLTLEMWVKTASSAQYATLISRMPSAFAQGMWALQTNHASSTAGDFALYVANYSQGVPLLLTSGVNVRDNEWHHIAIVRNGSAWSLYVDGISRATQTWAGTITDIAGSIYIGRDQNYVRYFSGYIDDLRITKGVARYTGNFTPPAAELPANITDDPNYNDVSLLLRGAATVGPFLVPVDESFTTKELIITGSPTLSSTVWKYASPSLAFDGSNSVISSPYNTAFNLSGFDFTIEMWIRQNTQTAQTPLSYNQGIGGGYRIDIAYDRPQWYINSDAAIVSTTNLNLNTWHHLAVCRLGSTTRMFLDGIQVGSTTTVFSDPTGMPFLRIGALADNPSFYNPLNGYIDDLRITKGVARYTKNFLPPPAELPAI